VTIVPETVIIGQGEVVVAVAVVVVTVVESKNANVGNFLFTNERISR
jgi:hypothetical protein